MAIRNPIFKLQGMDPEPQGTGEMDQTVKFLPCEHEDLIHSLEP